MINIGKVKAHYFPTFKKMASLLTILLLSFLKGNFPDSMFLSPSFSYEIESFVSQMDSKKSIGPYGIPVASVKILVMHCLTSRDMCVEFACYRLIKVELSTWPSSTFCLSRRSSYCSISILPSQ